MRRQQQKHGRDVSMSDVMPKFDNTLQMKMEASAANFRRALQLAGETGFIDSSPVPRFSIVEFVKTYPSFDEYTFLGYFTVVDLVTLRLLCKDTSQVFTDEIIHSAVRLGNLDPQIRINFWVL